MHQGVHFLSFLGISALTEKFHSSFLCARPRPGTQHAVHASSAAVSCALRRCPQSLPQCPRGRGEGQGSKRWETGPPEASAGAHRVVPGQVGPALSAVTPNSVRTQQPLTKRQRRRRQEQPPPCVASMACERERGVRQRVGLCVEGRKAGAGLNSPSKPRGSALHEAARRGLGVRVTGCRKRRLSLKQVPGGGTASRSSRCGGGWVGKAVVPAVVPRRPQQGPGRQVLAPSSAQGRGPAQGPRAGLRPSAGCLAESAVLQSGGARDAPWLSVDIDAPEAFSRGHDQGVCGGLRDPLRTHLGPCGSPWGLETASTLCGAGRAILSETGGPH